MDLLQSGNAAAAAVLLERVHTAEPGSTTALEGLARALFDAQRYADAAQAFGQLVERVPDDDYAHFGLGMALWRMQEFPTSRDHLAMAFVMRPQRAEYSKALAQVKATLRAREEGGLPLRGPIA